MNSEQEALADECLIAITDGQPLPARAIRGLPPWRAVLLARVAAKAGLGIEGGTLDQLVAEAQRVGGHGTLAWPPRSGDRVCGYAWQRLEHNRLWGEDDVPMRAARIWGYVAGQEVAAYVPVALAEDEPAARSYLAALAERDGL